MRWPFLDTSITQKNYNLMPIVLLVLVSCYFCDMSQTAGGNSRLARMVVHRLEMLSAKDQLIARHASVVGVVCPLKVLLAVLPPPLVPYAR